MAPDEQRLIGIGIYSLSEAQKLARVPRRSIRRWIGGYSYTREGRRYDMAPVWEGDISPRDSEVSLSFLDLMELRFVHQFRKCGVSWRVIRDSARRACEIFEQSHPFATRRFRTDGRSIFVEIAEHTGESKLIDLFKDQFAFHRIVAPSLYEGLQFSSEDVVERWYPLHPRKSVIIDPKLSFGRPVVADGSIPTGTLASAAKAEGSIRRVAHIYDVPFWAVRAAMDFEAEIAV